MRASWRTRRVEEEVRDVLIVTEGEESFKHGHDNLVTQHMHQSFSLAGTRQRYKHRTIKYAS